MTAMKGDIVNRVRRLPKPTKPSEALQPLFEAISNAMHAVEDKFNSHIVERGPVYVTIDKIKTPRAIEITVADNGIGLNSARFEAFCTTDTNFKVERGGKGIGRLLWLDAFSATDVKSIYRESDHNKKRSFRFNLDINEQITDEQIEDFDSSAETGTIVHFVGLRGNAYSTKFPSQAAALKRHFGSHFLAEFIMNRSAQVVLTIGKDSVTYPNAVSALLVENKGEMQLEVLDLGSFTVLSFLCRPAASADFDGSHQLHFTANGRTVVTRKIDGLLGIGRIGDQGLVYHGCVSGDFLNERVNQERTNFTFDEAILETITKQCTDQIRAIPLGPEIAAFDEIRLGAMNEFLDDYPSFRFETAEALLTKSLSGIIIRDCRAF